MCLKPVIVAFRGKLCTSSGIKPGIEFDFKANLRFQSPSKFSIEKCERGEGTTRPFVCLSLLAFSIVPNGGRKGVGCDVFVGLACFRVLVMQNAK